MAGALKYFSGVMAAAVIAGMCSPACAEDVSTSSTLADPTRPPSVLSPTAGSPAGTPAVTTGGLQTVIMRKGAKPLAVINGVAVELGGSIGDAKLVKLSESEAVLQRPSGREVLRLTPAVEKSAVAVARQTDDKAKKGRAKARLKPGQVQ
jgi:MSHA biogenesis protein MshK